jgi:hypothetical protein
LVKVFNTKVVSNTLIYLQKFFHIFLRPLISFPDFLSSSALNRISFQKIQNPFSFAGQTRQPDLTR